MPGTAGVTHEIVLDGQGYMLARAAGGRGGGAGAALYRKTAAGPGQLGMLGVNVQQAEQLVGVAAARQPESFRRVFWGRWRGSGRRFVSGGWTAAARAGLVSELVGLRPVLDGSALALAPQGVEAVADPTPRAGGLAGLHTTAISSTQVVAVGDRLFASADPGTNGSGLVFRATAGATVRGLAVYNGTVLVGTGTGLLTFNPASGATAAFAPATAAELLAAYQGVLFATAGAVLKWYIPAVGSWSSGITLESTITGLEELDGTLYLGTQTALYRLDGTLKPKSPSTAPAVLDLFEYTLAVAWRVPSYSGATALAGNFVKMAAWRGALWFWAQGQIMRGRPGAGGVFEVTGQGIFGVPGGMGICGGLLAASGEARPGSGAIWVNDGSLGEETGRGEPGAGWWKLAETTPGQWAFPFGNAGYGAGVINALRSDITASHTFTRWLLDPASPVGFRADNYGVARATVTGQVVLPAVMAEDLAGEGEQVQAVQLLRVGCEWAVIDRAAWWPAIDAGLLSGAVVVFALSSDGGRSWTDLNRIYPIVTNFYALSPANFYGNRVAFPVDAALASSLYPAGAGSNGQPVADPGWLVRVTWSGAVMPLIRRVWLDYRPVEVRAGSGLAWELELALNNPVIGLDGAGDEEPALTRLGRLWSLWQEGRTVRFYDLENALPFNVKVVGLEQRSSGGGLVPNLPGGWSVVVKLVEVYE